MASHKKGATRRDYAAEYAARKQRGLSRGLSLKQLRGHSGRGEETATSLRKSGLIGGGRSADVLTAKKYAAVARMVRGESLPQAAQHEGISPSTLRRFVKHEGIAQPLYHRRNGTPTSVRGYQFNSQGSTPILTESGLLITGPAVDHKTASLLGRYWNDVDTARKTGDGSVLKKYAHTVIHTLDGNTYHLMADLAALEAWYAALSSDDYYDYLRNFYSEWQVIGHAA